MIRKEIRQFLDQSDSDLHYIADLRELQISFSDLVVGLSQAFRTSGSSEMVRLGAKAVSEQNQYGKIPVQLFSSLDEAFFAINKQ